MRVIVRIDTPKDEVDFQKYLFHKDWGWTSTKIKNIRHRFLIGTKLLYYLYTGEEGFYYSNVTSSNNDYLCSISIREAKIKIFGSEFPTFVEVDE